MIIMIGTDMTNLTNTLDAKQRMLCKDLEEDVLRARLQMKNRLDHAEDLTEKIGGEGRLLENLRRQLERTGDEGFVNDITNQEAYIENLHRQVTEALETARTWEDEVSRIEHEMRANGCGFYV